MINTTLTLKDTVLSILTTMNSIRDGGTLNPFIEVAIWNNQIGRMKSGGGYGFDSPAIFLETRETNHERLGMGYKAYDLECTIHLLHEELDAMDGTLDQNVNVFHYRDLVIEYLDGSKPVQAGNLWYISDEQDFSHDNCYIFNIKFKCRVVDQIANTLPTLANPNPVLKVNYEWDSMNFGATGSTFSIPL